MAEVYSVATWMGGRVSGLAGAFRCNWTFSSRSDAFLTLERDEKQQLHPDDMRVGALREMK
jgi:hypothetical protein